MLRVSLAASIFWCAAFAPASTATDKASRQTAYLTEITDTAQAHRTELAFDGNRFSGPAWERLLAEGRSAQYFLIGEEHGIAENPLLAAQLFTTLAPSGFRRMVIEISPPMASLVDEALLEGGLEGLARLFAQPGAEPAFFGMAEEARMLAAVRAAVPRDEPALWGADYEISGDRALLRRLAAKPKPPAAAAALAALAEASADSWARHAATGDARHIFTFAGDPQSVRDLEQAWPVGDDESRCILETLEEPLEINRLWGAGQPFESNRRRAALLRSNFLRHWATLPNGESPRVMLKFGANHLVRGRNMTQTFDLGALLPELAAIRNSRTFSLLVLPGKDSPTAVLNPATWSYEAAPPKDGYRRGLKPVLAASHEDRFSLIDLRPLRAILSKSAGRVDAALLRVVFGFDMLLVMSGSTAAQAFQSAAQSADEP